MTQRRPNIFQHSIAHQNEKNLTKQMVNYVRCVVYFAGPLREEPTSPLHEAPPLPSSVAPPITVSSNHNPSSPPKLTSLLTTAKLMDGTVKKFTSVESVKTASHVHVPDVSIRFKFCVDLRSIHNVKIEPQYKCYLK